MSILISSTPEQFEKYLRSNPGLAIIGEKFRQLLVAREAAPNVVEKIEAVKKYWSDGLSSLPITSPDDDRCSPDPGMLAALGYHVRGTVEALPAKDRRMILDYVLIAEVLPPVKDWFYINQWSQPKTTIRALKLIGVLDNLVENTCVDKHRYETAASRWDNDRDYVEGRCNDLGIKLTFSKEALERLIHI